jgi:hypothetical protein
MSIYVSRDIQSTRLWKSVEKWGARQWFQEACGDAPNDAFLGVQFEFPVMRPVLGPATIPHRFRDDRAPDTRYGFRAKTRLLDSSLGAGLGVGVARGPVFGREGYVPESGIGQQEFDANLDLLVGKLVNVGDHAFERILGLRI